MSNIDKQALREAANAANAASWGHWESYKPHKGARGYEVKVGVKAVAQHCLKVDSVFIAAANPTTVLALLDELEALQSFRTAFNEWIDKTDWVQTDKRLDVIKPWGKHRADVLKLYIDHLESKLEAAEKQNALEVQIKARLCMESNSLHDRLREAEKRIAEQREYYEGVIADGSKRIAELREWNAGLAQESFERQQRIAEFSGQKRLIGWRASDYTDETSDPELAKNWAAAIGVLPIFEGDVNTKLSAAGIGKGE